MVKNAIDYAYARGVVLIAAAGNEDTSSSIFSYPAAYDNVIAVGATAKDDSKAGYSNYGSWVDVYAPGGDYRKDTKILSTVPKTGGILTHPSGYRSLQGTSMATPYVVGLAGLLLSRDQTFTHEEIKQILEDSADIRIDAKAGSLKRVNVFNALSKTITTITAPPGGYIPTKGFNFTGKAVALSGISEVRVSVYVQGRGWRVMNAPANYNPYTKQWSYYVSADKLRVGRQASLQLYVRAKDKQGNWSKWQYRGVYVR